MTAPALEDQNSCRKASARSSVANDINFTLPRGARHALIGPNGAGKTTLVNLITGGCGRRPATSCSTATTITRLPQAARDARAASPAPSRSTSCSAA